MNEIRILHLADSLRMGGTERQLAWLLKYLGDEKGFNSIFLPRTNRIEYDLQGTSSLQLRIPEGDLGILEYFNVLRSTVRTFKPHIIHTWEKTVAFAAAYLKVIHPHSFKLVDGTCRFSRRIPMHDTAYWMLKFSHFFADRVVGNSIASLGAHSHNPGGKFLMIPNGLDFNRFPTSDSTVSNKHIVLKIGMVASFTKPKDQMALLQSTTSLLNGGYSLEVMFVGDGPYKAQVKKAVITDLKDRFIFTGKVQDVDRLTAQMDIGVLLNNPGHAEGMSNAIMEYMAAGLPVVCTDAGGNSELVEHGVNGFLVPFGKTSALKESLMKLLMDSELRKSMGLASRRMAEQKFPFKNMFESYLALYRSFV